MKVWKFKKDIEIEKTIGNYRIETFHCGSYKNGKPTHWTELHCWYECNSEHCPLSWEDRSYEGECNDWGCFMAKKGRDEASMLICMLPRWIKKILLKHKQKVRKYKCKHTNLK